MAKKDRFVTFSKPHCCFVLPAVHFCRETGAPLARTAADSDARRRRVVGGVLSGSNGREPLYMTVCAPCVASPPFRVKPSLQPLRVSDTKSCGRAWLSY